MSEKQSEKQNLKQTIKRLSEISNWFDAQEEVDLEEGIKKVKEASALLKASKKRLHEIENEFEEIKRDIEEEIEEE